MKDSATERVGRYQLLELIGVGPCGSVSRAKVFGVAGFERQFAVKRFHPELTITAAMAQGLSAAARAYGSLEHPRIARMSEFGVAQAQTFTAVELVAGLDAMRLIAEARLAGTTLAAGGALGLISQAARAVGYAHGRGLTHLGLAPTNVIVTADGDIKITDFGVLAAGLPPRPIDVARLEQRIPYLAPEQLANEATSAATDVFALGVIAYELVSGQRTFTGDTPQEVADAILNGPPPEPALPRPIVRVLHRCLARSPFERFPDARALADALDAALRVAPVPGTRKDIGAQVKTVLDRIAELHASELSGVLAFNVGTGPIKRPAAAPAVAIATLGRDSQADLATGEFKRSEPLPSEPVFGPATTLPDLPRQVKTMAGLPPPPIAVPPGLGPPPIPLPSMPGPRSTVLGVSKPKPAPVIPTIKAPKSTDPGTGAPPRAPSAITVVRKPEVVPTPAIVDARAMTDAEPPSMDVLFPEDELSKSTVLGGATLIGLDAPEPAPAPRPPEPPEDKPKVVVIRRVRERDPTEGIGELAPLLEDASIAFPDEPRSSASDEYPEFEEPPPNLSPQPSIRLQGRPQPQPLLPYLDSPPMVSPPMPSPPPIVPTPSPMPSRMPSPMASPLAASPAPVIEQVQPAASPPRKRRVPVILALVVIIGGALGVGGWQLYLFLTKDASSGVATAKPTAVVADASTTKPGDAAHSTASVDAAVGADAVAVATAPVDASQPGPADAASPADATSPADAASAADAAATPADAAATPADAAAPVPTSSDKLKIISKPAGAHLYLDGAEAGVTPVELPGSADRHTISLLLAGHDLYVAQVDGHGAFTIPLKEVTPSAGPAGIKIIKCKDKDRYYVYVDGQPTGMMCPTERIEVEVGPHTVEVYDAITESRKKWDVVVKDTRLSLRVKLE